MRLLQHFKNLFKGRSGTEEEWKEFITAWPRNCDSFCRELARYVPEKDMAGLLANLTVPALRNGFIDEARKEELFDRIQEMDFHLTSANFYSPIPDTRSLPAELWTHRYDTTPGWSLREPAQLDLLSKLGAFSGELQQIAQNTQFNEMDSSIYYAMIRHFNSRNIVEVGAGFSTLISAAAATRNGHTTLTAIEPFPRDFLKAGIPGLAKLIEQPVQAIPIETFTALDASDILFIDSTHVSKIGSDVNYLILEILPRLKPGVVVHIHDIFLPWNMPEEWVVKRQIFWNEQYLLLAFLQGNPSFEVLLANHYLGVTHPEKVKDAFPRLTETGGGSFWIRRVA
jgi:methyltransferase family protein